IAPARPEERAVSVTIGQRRERGPADLSPSDDDDPDEDRVQIRMVVPAAVRAAFDEGLDLHRAVSGHEASVTSFVEALVAEAFAGPRPPDIDLQPVLSGQSVAALEEVLARATDNWRSLTTSDRAQSEPEDAEPLDGLLEATETARRLQDVSDAAGTGGAVRLDERCAL